MLIVCPHFRNIEYGVVDSFKRLGIDVFPFFFNVGMDSWHLIQRMKNKLGINIDDFLNREKIKFNKKLLEQYYQVEPDIVYVIQGRWMDPATVREMNKKSYTALYLWDMLSLFPEMIPGLKEYNIIYSFDRNDTDILLNQHYNARFKPSGYDASIYYPLKTEKKYDVSFIGAMYPDRVVMLDELIRSFPDIRWGIFGEYAPVRRPVRYIKWLFSGKRKYYKNRNINKQEVNEVYNQSRIVLSIVRGNQTDGWSSRLTEILGSSAFQVTNYFPSVEKNFSDSLVMYKNTDELKKVIGHYLANETEREQIALNGYEKVKDKYSDDSINRMILDDYYVWNEKSRVEIKHEKTEIDRC